MIGHSETTAKPMPTHLLSYAGYAMRVPVWCGQLLTGAKSFGDNPIIGSRRFNEWGLHVARLKVAHRLAAKRRVRLADLVTAEDRTAFDRDGFIVKRDFLPAGQFEALVAQVKDYRGHAREMVQGDTITRRIALDPLALAQMPMVRDLVRLPRWSGLIRYVNSSAAQPLYYIQSILTHVGGSLPDPQTYLHADTFQPTVKAWLFLTDVAPDAAPLTYVRGSHRLSRRRLAWERRMSLDARRASDFLTRRGSFRIRVEELGSLGLPPPHAFAVPANTLVVADTFGFHARGPSTRPAHRVEIWAYGRRSPFLPWAGFDFWNIGSLGHWRVPLFWRIADMFERLGIKRNVWRRCSPRSAFAPETPSADR
jgi:hypothetical protein